MGVWLNTSCAMQFDVAEPTPFVLMLRPRSGGEQWIGAEDYVVLPEVPVFEFTDAYGNLCQRLVAPVGRFRVSSSARVRVSASHDERKGARFVPIELLPHEALAFLVPSRYCESDRFSELARNLGSADDLGYDQVKSIVDYVRRTTIYAPGMGQEFISACEVQ